MQSNFRLVNLIPQKITARAVESNFGEIIWNQLINQIARDLRHHIHEILVYNENMNQFPCNSLSKAISDKLNHVNS